MSHLQVLRLIVASPSDVDAERDIVSRIVEEVNRNNARPRGLHIDVYRWETDSHPGFHPKGPQGLIDTKLKIEDCDILIGIFWRRFGTPVSDAKSGTEHEFRIAYRAWQATKKKPQIFVYFSQKPYAPRSTKEIEQWGLVLKFKEEFPPEGLWWDYPDESGFEHSLRDHLTQFLNELSATDLPQPAPQIAVPSLTSLFQLPPPPGDFTGREAELRELRDAIEKGGIHISGLQGQGGVGKTALALKLAAELAPKFPDAQIHLDLKGVSEKPLTAAEALAHVVRSFHPEAKLPDKEEELRVLYNGVLRDKRALLLMDNARDAAQVQPLIPPQGCTLLVTSRNHFYLAGLHAKDLNTLPAADAEKLLLRIASRIGSEAAAIAKLCGYLPQALRLAATAVAEKKDLSPADYKQKLADEKHRLEVLGGSDKGIEASITMSYNLLDPEAQTHWRMLGVFPDTFDASAAAAIWATDETKTGNGLSDLLKLSMLEWDETAHRYRLHDLMRDFARSQLRDAERNAAALRHAKHYANVLSGTNRLYMQGGEAFMRGLALFDLEWGNIQAGQAWSTAHGKKNREAAQLCNRYPDEGFLVLYLRHHPQERISWLESGLAAARWLGDREREANHLGNLGIAYDLLGDYRRAIGFHEQSLAIDRESGDKGREGQDLGNLGVAYRNLGEYHRAVEHLEQVLTINRETGNRREEGYTLGNLAGCFFSLGEYQRALDYQERDLAITREIRDRPGEGAALGNLGNAYGSLGDDHRAIEYYEQQLAIARESSDRRGEGNALWNMRISFRALGNRKLATAHAEAALKIFEQIEHPSTTMVKARLETWSRESQQN